MSRAWRQQNERGSRAAMALLAWVTLKLGRRIGRVFLPPICLYFIVFSRRSRAASAAYLRRVLGRRPRLAEIYRHYHAFASTIHDRVVLMAGRADSFAVRVEGAEAFDAALAEGRGCIVLGAHLGSFDMLRVGGVVARDLAINVLMDTHMAAKLDGVLKSIGRGADGIRAIPMGGPDSLLRVRECLERGEIVGILGDRIWRDRNTVSCTFLGTPARFPLGPLRLANALGVPVVLGFGLYRGANRYTLYFERLDPPPVGDAASRHELLTHWVAGYVARLEHYVRLAPDNWFNFYDFWGEREPV